MRTNTNKNYNKRNVQTSHCLQGAVIGWAGGLLKINTMKQAHLILDKIAKKAKYRDFKQLIVACISYKDETSLMEAINKSMEEYADQWKYDFSKGCKCNDSPGSTWCCNLCGLPIDNDSPSNAEAKIIEKMQGMCEQKNGQTNIKSNRRSIPKRFKRK